MDLSVVICTYNGAQRVGDVITALEQQDVPANIKWEVIVVDNNSTDNTADTVNTYKNNPILAGRLHYILETTQGQGFARQTGVESSNGSLIAFLDDDTIPNSDWVAQAYSFAKEHPTAGAFGGQIHAALDVPAPTYFDGIVKLLLAVVERGDQPTLYTKKSRMLPPGAGIVVRKQVWLDYVPIELFFSGRVGNSGMANEDIEALAYIQNANWEIWYNPKMHLYHQIPSSRLSLEYLTRLAKGVGHGRYHMRRIRMKKWQRPVLLPVMFLNDIMKYIKFQLKRRKTGDHEINDQLTNVTLLSTIESPFFLARRKSSTKN